MIEIYNIYMDNPTVIISFILMIFYYYSKPKKINSWYGYRTPRSIQNQEQWDLAQKYSATLSLYLLFILLLIQIVVYKIIKDDAISSLLTITLFVLTFIIIFYNTEKKIISHINKKS